MLREFKFLRRNSGKAPNVDEIENVPVNPSESLVTRIGIDSSRPPLNTIQDPIHNPRARGGEHELGFKNGKVDRTPSKARSRYSDSGMVLLPTPEKQAATPRGRFGWGLESRDDGKVDYSNCTGQSSRGVGGNVHTPRSCRTFGRGNSGCSEVNSTQSTPTKSVTKPPNHGMFLPGGGARPPSCGNARMGNVAAFSKGVPVFGSSSTTVNSVEVPHFDLKEDPSFWMDHSVQVLIRIRPLNGMERSTSGYSRCLKQESAQCVTWIGQPETQFTFDHVACETIDQETLFRMVGLPMVENCLSGYNSCMFAYGQTGSGKTHTMLGEINELEVNPSPNRGITPRMFEFLFARIIAEEESRRDERLKYNCKCSFLEIYNEQITDLLDPSSTNLQLREDAKKGVYVENLSEFEVHTVGDILQLLSQGSLNRKVAATNMNRESSRSHSVFTCVIESKWEKDSTSNLRFARLNLVDLAGSERQKASGAEGERLKEAASINKSLSTLGHVIMVLVDVSNAKSRHIPYRDSRLTFLLQDSLGGNSKTMIIANVSPSLCCAADTLNTLKFAQRAKLIQNNAVVNEDMSGDVMALQHQIQLLKEELAALKRHNISRSLTFGPTIIKDASQELDNDCNDKAFEYDQQRLGGTLGCVCKGNLRFSSEQLKSVETTLTGALRREKMAGTSIKQLEAEMEQLNRLVRQREEETRCTKMMLKFREDKIQRMESVLGGLMTADAYLLEENNALTEENQMFRDKVDRNPEVTRFAQENIRLMEELRRFQDFYEEGEREMLLNEVHALRDQLVLFLDGDSKQENLLNTDMQPKEAINVSKENDTLQLKLKTTLEELEECRSNLNSCLEKNAKLSSEIFDLTTSLKSLTSSTHDSDGTVEVVKESIFEAPLTGQSSESVQKEKEKNNENLLMQTEDAMNLQLELDILRIIVKEERSSRCELEDKAVCLSRDLKLAEGNVLLLTQQCEDVKEELVEARSVIEALESQQLISIAELEDLRKSNDRYAEVLREQKLKINSFNEQVFSQALRDEPASKHGENEVSPLQAKLNKMQGSLERAKRLNMWYQTDRACHASSEEETEEARKQVEAETAEVIVCLQEELGILQQQVHDSTEKERETEEKLMLLQSELKEMQEKLCVMTQCNKNLGELIKEKENDLKSSSEEWELLTTEIEEVLAGGNQVLEDASNQLNAVSGSFPQKRTWISEQLHKVTRCISEKELLIEELNRCLEEANKRQNDLDCMLRSLRGAALVINEAHQQDCTDKDKEILQLTSQLTEKNCTIVELLNKINQGEEQIRKASFCAKVAFVIVNRFSEMNDARHEALKHKDGQLGKSNESIMKKEALIQNQAVVIDEAGKQVQSLQMELKLMKENCRELNMQLFEEKKRATLMEWKFDEVEESNILNTKEKLSELKAGVSSMKSCMKEYVEQEEGPAKVNGPASSITFSDENCETRTVRESSQGINSKNLNAVDDSPLEVLMHPLEPGTRMSYSANQKIVACERTLKDASHKDTTIILLKEEIESTLESFKEVQKEMSKLQAEKLQFVTFEEQSQKSIAFLMTQILDLQTSMNSFEEKFEVKMVSLNHNIQTIEESLHESMTSWSQEKKLYELELGDAKTDAAEKAVESCCILAAFEEAQHTVREADIMINKLMITNETMKLELGGLKKKEADLINEKTALINEIQSLQTISSQKDLHYADLEKAQNSVKEADIMINGLKITNETMKLEIEGIKKKEVDLINEKNALINEVQSLQTISSQKDLHYADLEKQFEADVVGMRREIEELEDLVFQVQTICEQAVMPMASDFFCMKTELHDLGEMMQSSLEDIWLEIISRDFAVSVLNVCHMGILLETVTGLNVENNLLYHGLCETNSALSELRDQNSKSRRELEMCQLVKGKLLSDIKNNFDRISRKEDETGKLTIKVADFEKRIQDIQLLEGEMLKRSNYMGSELTMLMKELTLSNENMLTSLLKQEKLLKEKDEQLSSLEEKFMVDSSAKELEALFLASELEVMALQRSTTEKEKKSIHDVLENCKKELIIKEIDTELKGWSLLDSEIEVARLRKEVDVMGQKQENMLALLAQRNLEILHMKESNISLEQEVKLLKNVACSYDTLRCEINGLLDAKMQLSSGIQKLDLEHKKLQEEITLKEKSIEISSDCISVLDQKNKMLQSQICLLETSSHTLQAELQIQVDRAEALKSDNNLLRDELKSHDRIKVEALDAFSLYHMKFLNSVENVDVMNARIIDMLNERSASLHNSHQEICKDLGRVSTFIEDFECLENLAKELISEKSDLQVQLGRKDEVLEGLVFDMRLLQESASSTKDQTDEIEELKETLEALEKELDGAIARGQVLDAQLQDKMSIISSIELDVERERELAKLLSTKNCLLTANLEDALKVKESSEEELAETRKVNNRLETEMVELGSALGQLNSLIESLKSNLDSVACERDDLHAELLDVKKEFEMARALAEENEAIALEARQVAETQKAYAEDKEMEVKLLERSVEELESTVNVQESEIDMVKQEAERQRLEREELELEFHAFKQQMTNVKICDTDMKRHLDQKETTLQEALHRTQILEKEIATKDADIAQCKAHISELNMHAEAQAQEYKQTFKALEAMADQVKTNGPVTYMSNSSSIKLEKNGSKSRGSGSPFKCIGMGLVQQMKSERDEELTAERLHIEELEALAANRQKEIFMLNSKLAATESMTHDVIRDLLGIKLNMTSYTSLVDNQQIEEITEKARLHNAEAQIQEQEVIKLKEQLKAFVEEKNGWLDEINRKQTEIVCAQIALEKLRERDQLLTTENEMFKMEIVNLKKKVVELEDEVKKLSGQQNLQQRIHHHAKIKEENNLLRVQNENLSSKLRRTEASLSRLKEEISQIRADNGRNPHAYAGVEQQLNDRLKDSEEEKRQLAQKLVALCTSIGKISGVTRPSSSAVSVSMAQEALEQLHNRVICLEKELKDVKHKNRNSNERICLSEFMPQPSPLTTPNRSSQTTFLSSFHR